jgi:hypothetical protein
MKKLIILLFSFLVLIQIKPLPVNAADLMILDELGTYEQVRPVMQTVKVNITADMASNVRATGTNVVTLETKHYFLWFYSHSTYQYYYLTDMFVDQVVQTRTLKNDIDSLIFVIQELEYFASIYTTCKGQEATDCILGFVRSINKGYVGNYNNSNDTGKIDQWFVTAGPLNTGFVDFVNTKDGSLLGISEFFSSFISKTSYNFEVHKSSSKSGFYADGILDPFNPGGKIDLIHLFASMDGIYNDTSAGLDLGLRDYGDQLSWGGDLQTFARKMFENNIDINIVSKEINSWSMYDNRQKDFCVIVGISDCKFSNDDMLADIDANNIIRGFINNSPVPISTFINGITHTTYVYNDLNKLSVAIAGYYNVIKYDNSYFPNRYLMFTKTIGLNNGMQSITNTNQLRDRVYKMLKVQYNTTGNTDLKKDWYSSVTNIFNLDYDYLMCINGDPNEDLVDFKYRESAAKLFYDYISYMASKPAYYGG